MRTFAWIGLLAAGLMILFGGDAALADQPRPWQFGFQEPVTDVMREINGFHNMLLVIIAAISALVLGLLVYVMVRFNAKANPTPSKVSHNTLIEVVWTVIPILILVVIAIPSFRVLYFIDTVPEADITVKATGYQWNWGYEYPDIFGDEEFIANMVPEEELSTDMFGNPQPRLLAADFDVVVPVDKTVRVIVTAGDVLHAWAMPAFGIKMDAVPGRLNETWFKADKEGVLLRSVFGALRNSACLYAHFRCCRLTRALRSMGCRSARRIWHRRTSFLDNTCCRSKRLIRGISNNGN